MHGQTRSDKIMGIGSQRIRERTVENEPRTGPYVYLIRGLSPIPLPSSFSLVFGILVNRTSCSDQTPVAYGNVNSNPFKPTAMYPGLHLAWTPTSKLIKFPRLLRSFYAPFPVCYVVLGEGRWVEKNHVLQGLSGWSRFCRAS